MSRPYGLSLKAKISWGLLISYTSFESYLQLRTRLLIQDRQKQLDSAQGNEQGKFSSATVLGMYVNPFEEYRPQTGFEFILVRILEFAESLYGNVIELHDKYQTPEGEIAEVDQLLRTFQPHIRLMKQNSEILQSCLSRDDFSDVFKTGISSHNLPLRDQLLFTWLGQSCSLIQLSGINILTDPLFSDHLLSKSIGPKRLVPSPMTVEDVRNATNNKLDFILVSHNHPDHLDLEAAQKLGNSALWIVPMGLKKTLSRLGIDSVIEMDWWDEINLNRFVEKGTNSTFPDKIDVVCVPAMHWSGRHIIDSNTSLWGSFIIRRNGESVVYHAGDTGYVKKLFDTIGHEFGPVYLSLLPIGQYCPAWHQKPRHISPEESLLIARSVRSQFLLGVHFGTFKLSSEPILEPKNKLLDLARHSGKQGAYNVPEFGLTYAYNLRDGEYLAFFDVD